MHLAHKGGLGSAANPTRAHRSRWRGRCSASGNEDGYLVQTLGDRLPRTFQRGPSVGRSTPFCVKCGIVKPYRILILVCTFSGSALLWWAFSLSTWVRIEIPSGSQVLFSALFAICSGEIKCWIPLSKSNDYIFGRIFMISALLLSFFLSFILLVLPHSLPDTRKQYFVFTIVFFVIGICVFLALLLHSLHVLKVTNLCKDAKITFLYPTFILSFSAILFFLSGILCLFSSHHCWLQCVLQQPIQVKPMQMSVVSGNSAMVTERTPGRDG
uniref:Transmembrane protein 225B n=1 Tax=Sus scrofa TaxID=9823 RepID=A0A4X1VDT5_PIG